MLSGVLLPTPRLSLRGRRRSIPGGSDENVLFSTAPKGQTGDWQQDEEGRGVGFEMSSSTPSTTSAGKTISSNSTTSATSSAAHWVAVAFDYGLKRIGVAAGDSVTRQARPVTTLRCGPAGVDWAAIERVVGELQPSVLVVGVPLNVDGTPGELTGLARQFAAELERRHGIRTATVDERWSSVEAAQHLKEARQSGRRTRRVQREDIDAASACVILERWLAHEP